MGDSDCKEKKECGEGKEGYPKREGGGFKRVKKGRTGVVGFLHKATEREKNQIAKHQKKKRGIIVDCNGHKV